MTLHETAIFALIASLLVVSPGPNGLLILMTVPRFGQLAGFASIAGFAAAFIVHGTLSVLGISVLLTQSAAAFTVVKTLGAVYLCWIGGKALLSALTREEAKPSSNAGATRRTLRQSFWAGFITNGLNPKVSMFYLAAFPQFIPLGTSSIQSAYLLIALHILIATCWFTCVVTFSAQIGRWSERRGIRRWLSCVTGVALIGFGLKLLTYRASA